MLGEQRLNVPQPRRPKPRAEPRKPKPRRPAAGKGDKGAGKVLQIRDRVSNLDWADETLEHKEKDGEQLCFRFQRSGKCAGKDGDCEYCHDDWCGICGSDGHLARNCPEK